MQLSFFTMPIHPLGKPVSQSIEEDRDAFILADERGFIEGYCAEPTSDQAKSIALTVAHSATLFPPDTTGKIVPLDVDR